LPTSLPAYQPVPKVLFGPCCHSLAVAPLPRLEASASPLPLRPFTVRREDNQSKAKCSKPLHRHTPVPRGSRAMTLMCTACTRSPTSLQRKFPSSGSQSGEARLACMHLDRPQPRTHTPHVRRQNCAMRGLRHLPLDDFLAHLRDAHFPGVSAQEVPPPTSHGCMSSLHCRDPKW